MKKSQRYNVLIGLHESRVADTRRLIGQLEQRFQVEVEAITQIESERAQAALYVNHLLHEQYVHYCTHLQDIIVRHQNAQQQIHTESEQAWEEMRQAQQELDIFLSLQERQLKKETITEKRREQRQCQDFALMKWLEAGS